jgi:wyosine [tRNA(Phe)-imidazoG37] synthetase (radical SAM superfamily)
MTALLTPEASTRSFLADIPRLYTAYKRLNLTTNANRKQSPEEYLRALLEQLQCSSGHSVDAILTDARQKHGEIPLVHVLTSQYYFQRRMFAEAAAHARTAISLDQRDLHAQRLLLAASEESVSLESNADVWLKDRFCTRPFETLETRATGEASTCCAAWMPASIGRLGEANSADELWNSPAAEEIRRSILDGNFQYCSRMYCQKIANRELGPKLSIFTCSTRMEEGPREVVLSHDRSCNLSCPSCRTSLIVEKKEKQNQLMEITATILMPLLAHAQRVHLTGSGDPFASNHFRHLIIELASSKYRHVKLQLQTNGLLLDEGAWSELQLEGRVHSIWVSIDAASAAVYTRVRRGGSYERLLENLEFLSRLRQENRFKVFRLDTVVQWLNYKEIPHNNAMGERLHADRISFQMLRNWGTFSLAEFNQHNIGNPDHPEYLNFIEVLRDPIVTSPKVGLSTMRPFVELARH